MFSEVILIAMVFAVSSSSNLINEDIRTSDDEMYLKGSIRALVLLIYRRLSNITIIKPKQLNKN